ncbi:hypothetical protein MBLNU230_g5870t1 [Neophaeotheca triangularis]
MMPDNMIHSEPTLELESCGSNCCPMGYQCQDDRCYAMQDAAKTSNIPSASMSAPTASITVSAPVSTSSPPQTASAGAAGAQTKETEGDDTDPTSASTTHDDGDGFSGRSFVAGFLPGIFIGGILIALLLYFCVFRKKRNTCYADSDEEKRRTRDQLTSLGPSPALSYRPTMHGRSISEPVTDVTGTHRTDFARGTPPRMQPFDEKAEDLQSFGNTTSITSPSGEKAAATPKSALSRLSTKLWSPSDMTFSSPAFKYDPSTPIPTQPPLPAHLKRGTLSVLPLFQKTNTSTPSSKNKITPIRELRKQRSERSLHRRMTEEANPNAISENRRSASGRWMWPMRPNHLKTPSQEEIMIGVDRSGSDYISPHQPRHAAQPQQQQQQQQRFSRPRAASVASTQTVSSIEDSSPVSPTFLSGGSYTHAPASANHNPNPHKSTAGILYPYSYNGSVNINPNADDDTPTRQPLHPAQHTTTLSAASPPRRAAKPPTKPPTPATTATAITAPNTLPTASRNLASPFSSPQSQTQNSTVTNPTPTPQHFPTTAFHPSAPQQGEQRFTTFGDLMQRAGVREEDLHPRPAVPALPAGAGTGTGTGTGAGAGAGAGITGERGVGRWGSLKRFGSGKGR